MRVLLIHRYFAPDTPPYAHLLREIALALADAGHDVQVLTCQPSYNRAVVAHAQRNERLAGQINVRRWPVLPDRSSSLLKLANLVWFCLRLVLAYREFRRADAVMAASTPPIAVAKVARFLAGRSDARFIYHKQDIYPEVVVAPGILPNGRRAAFLRWLDSRTDKAADRIVVLSEDMADTIVGRGIDRDKVRVINNFDPWDLEDCVSTPGPLSGEAPLDVVFAGNLGRFQNLETVIAAVELLKGDPRFVFHFFGSGALSEDLAAWVHRDGLTSAHLHGYQKPEVVADFLRRHAHLGIVSLIPGVIGAAYPSKTMSYLRQGCPVLAIVEAESSLASTVIAAGAGFQASPTDPQAVVDALRALADEREKLLVARDRAMELYKEQFDRRRQLGRWREVFEEMDPAS